MAQFVVTIVAAAHRQQPYKEPLARIYEGNDYEDARNAAELAFASPCYHGCYLRFFNFALFGGGMTDTLIKY